MTSDTSIYQYDEDNIYTRGNLRSELARRMADAFDSHEDLRNLKENQILSIINIDPVHKLMQNLIMLGSVPLELKNSWYGPLIAEQSLRDRVTHQKDMFNWDTQRELFNELIGPETEAEKPAWRAKRVEGLRKEFVNRYGKEIINMLSNWRFASELELMSSPLVRKRSFTLEDGTAYYNIPMKIHNPADYACEDTELHLSQLEEHFPDVKAVTDWICANRFIKQGRQDTYLHIQAPSGWGKTSIFMQAWKDLGYAHETTVHNVVTAVNGQTGGESAKNFVKATVIFFDEANYFNHQLKNITRTIPITEKFKGKVEVPIFAKIMVSQEDPKFLEDYANEQVANRYNKITYVDRGLKQYKDFAAEHGYSYDDHYRVHKWLIVTTMNKWINAYRSDREQCELDAAKVMDNFYKNFGAHNTVKTAETDPGYVGRIFRAWIEERKGLELGEKGITPIKTFAKPGHKYDGYLYCENRSVYDKIWQQFVKWNADDWKIKNADAVTRKWILTGGSGGSEVVKVGPKTTARHCFFVPLEDEVGEVGEDDHIDMANVISAADDEKVVEFPRSTDEKRGWRYNSDGIS